jgi:mannose-6-phosphate isomerase-like protein (cupin superfamily)
MSVRHHTPTKVTLAEAIARVNVEPVPYALLFERADLAIELYVPRGHTQMTTHEQDEIYLVLSGAAILDLAGERVTCGAGDLLYVPAGKEHRFESFSNDFRTWVVYMRPAAAPSSN